MEMKTVISLCKYITFIRRVVPAARHIKYVRLQLCISKSPLELSYIGRAERKGEEEKGKGRYRNAWKLACVEAGKYRMCRAGKQRV